MKAALCLLACLLLACGTSRKPAPSVTDAGTPPAAAPMPEAAPAAAAVPSPPPSAANAVLYRVIEQKGEPDSQRIAGLGQRFATGGQASVVVDLPNGARVHVEPSSHVYVLEFEPSAVLVVAGSVFVELLPAGNQAGRSGLRVITALGSVLVSNTAELWVSQRNWPKAASERTAAALTSQSYLVMLRGIAELAHFDAKGALQSEPLASGQILPAGLAANTRPVAGTLDAARAASVEFMRKRRSPVALGGDEGRFESALAELEQERGVGAALLARIAPPPAPGLARVPALSPDAGVRPASVSARIGSAAQVRAYQRELARHAQRKHALRAVVLLAAERSLFVALAACDLPAAAACPGWSSWQTRYATRLDGAL